MTNTIDIPFSFTKWILTVSAIVCSIKTSFAQSVNCDFYFDKNLKDTIYTEATNPPVFGENKEDLFKFLFETIKVEREQVESYSEKIFISITINKQGRIIDSEIIRGGNDEINKIVLAQINKITEWTPANCNEKDVNFRMTIPMNIHFKK